MSIGDLELERVAARGWQAEHVRWLGQWCLRANDGFTGRANSVLPLGDPGLALDDALDEVGRWYAGFGLPARFALPAPARDDLRELLDGRGWTPSWGARVMVADLAHLPATDTRGAPDVAIAPEPSSGWEAAYHYRGAVALPLAGRRLLVRADVVGFAEVVVEGQVVAIGRGTVVDGWLGITAVEVHPSHRRRGLATQVLAALAGWARDHGADRAYLQVELTNDVAAAMYRRVGFRDHHTYAYLDPPA